MVRGYIFKNDNGEWVEKDFQAIYRNNFLHSSLQKQTKKVIF